jgi:hypothetical protein
MLVAEGASSFQRQLTAIIRDLQSQLRELAEAAEHHSKTEPLAEGETPVRSPVVCGEPSLATASAALAPSRPGSTDTTTHVQPRAASAGGADSALALPIAVPVDRASTANADADQPNTTPAQSPTAHDSDRPVRPRSYAERPTRLTTTGRAATRRDSMWQHWLECRAAGRPVTGAELDRVFGTNNYGRRVINEWVLAGRITSADVAAARSGFTSAAAA